jgi:TRAP-type C4-dicarboxylate transport system permease large subunit
LSLVIAAVYGRLNWQVIKKSVVDTLYGTAVIFFVSIGAVLLSRFIALSGIPFAMSDMAEAWGIEGYWLILFCGLVFLLLGMFLDPIGLLLIALPVFLPLIEKNGFDLIWFGILVIKFVEIGLITPPVGLSVYAIKGVVGDTVGLGTIFNGILWFLACEFLVVVLLVAFPAISLYLPNLMR